MTPEELSKLPVGTLLLNTSYSRLVRVYKESLPDGRVITADVRSSMKEFVRSDDLINPAAPEHTIFYTRQSLNDSWRPTTEESIFSNSGIWEPFVVYSREEKDYMDAMQLMLGKTILTHIYGARENALINYPPTYLKIDLSLD